MVPPSGTSIGVTFDRGARFACWRVVDAQRRNADTLSWYDSHTLEVNIPKNCCPDLPTGKGPRGHFGVNRASAEVLGSAVYRGKARCTELYQGETNRVTILPTVLAFVATTDCPPMGQHLCRLFCRWQVKRTNVRMSISCGNSRMVNAIGYAESGMRGAGHRERMLRRRETG